jgi:hypothetical protein
MRSLRFGICCGWIAVVTAAVGCGVGGPARAGVTGEVRFDGYPLPVGTVTFLPIKSGVAVSADVSDGTFVLPPGEGPSPGEYKVEVVSYQETGRMVRGPSVNRSGKSQELVQVIPDAYNARTTLQFTVTAGENTCKLELKANP